MGRTDIKSDYCSSGQREGQTFYTRREREREREAVKTAGIQIGETKLCTRNAIHTIVHEIESVGNRTSRMARR